MIDIIGLKIKRNMKNVLVSAYTHINLGDDLFLKILFDRYPDIHFTLIGNKEQYQGIFESDNVTYLTFPNTLADKKFVRRILIKLFRYQFLKRQFRAKKKFLETHQHIFDATITIGGSIFMEKKDERLNKFNVSKLFLDVFPQKPKFIIGANFGPFENTAFVQHYKNLFTNFTDVCFRDTYSKSLFSELENVRNHADIVFAGNFKPAAKIPDTVGFSVMDLTYREGLSQYEDQYISWIVTTAISAIENGKTISLFSFCQYEGDERAIKQIVSFLPEHVKNKVESIFYRGNIDQFLKQYSSIEKMYTSRFHAMILSFLFKQEIHPLIYSKKMKNVLEDLSFTGNYTDLGSMKLHIGSYNDFKLPETIQLDAQKQFKILDQFLT